MAEHFVGISPVFAPIEKLETLSVSFTMYSNVCPMEGGYSISEIFCSINGDRS